MSDEYDSAPGGSEAGALISLEDLTPAEFMAYPEPVDPVQWAVTWYPVSMKKFKKLSKAARDPGKPAMAAFADDAPDEDIEAVEAAAMNVEDDPGEDTMLAGDSGPEPTAPGKFNNFIGIPDTGWRPPDNTVAVGQKTVLTGVNIDLAGYSKSGTLNFRWPNMTTLFRNVLPTGAGLFDPRVIYDHYERRWLIIVDARRNSPAGSWIMVAASKTNNPGGAYWVWALDARKDGGKTTNNWADYTTVGIDTQGLYMSSNMFAFSGGFQYSKLRILKKAELYSGGVGASHAIKWYDFWKLKNPDGSDAFTVQPCMHYRGLGSNPPAYLVNALWPSGRKLTFWTLTDPVGYWSGRTPQLSKTSVKCRSYDLPPDAIQKDSSTRLETNDDRLLNAIYQNVHGTRRIWTCHTSKITWSGDSEARSCVQWYEFDVGTSQMIQQNAYGASGRYYFFPAIQTDINRNTFVVFSRSSKTEFGSLRYTGRRENAPANDLQNSRLIKAGESVYSGRRWGDYFGICRDGDNSSRVWCYGEYAAARGRWGTWVAEIGY